MTFPRTQIAPLPAAAPSGIACQTRLPALSLSRGTPRPQDQMRGSARGPNKSMPPTAVPPQKITGVPRKDSAMATGVCRGAHSAADRCCKGNPASRYWRLRRSCLCTLNTATAGKELVTRRGFEIIPVRIRCCAAGSDLVCCLDRLGEGALKGV